MTDELLQQLIDICSNISNWLVFIGCLFFFFIIVGATFAFCKIAYKTLMRFA